MKLIRSLDELSPQMQGGALTIGNFDGVHRGHARIMQAMVQSARSRSGPSVVFTFEPHPAQLLRPGDAPPPLSWLERKVSLLAELGVDYVFAYPTEPALLELSPRAFFEQIVRDTLAAKSLIEGPNFFFGKNRSGTVETLRQLTMEHQIALQIVEPLEMHGGIVSSSRVRALVRQGAVDQVAQLLTQPFRTRGLVVRGAARGAKIGFPTANLIQLQTLIPANGVYAGRAYSAGKQWPAAINIGPNPTFSDSQPKVEVHLIGFSGSLYDQSLEVDFLTRLRDIQTFESASALTEQLTRDVAAARQIGAAATDHYATDQ